MITAKLNSTSKTTSGFTIVELLIVIVVIAILAAITVIAFTGIQTRAEETKLQADLSNASKLVQKDHALTGNYPANEGAVNDNQGFSPSQGTDLQYTVENGEFCISAASTARNAKAFHFSSETGSVEEGICSGHTAPVIGGSETGTVLSIVAGNAHNCAIASGTAYCWGSGTYGQLGNGTTSVQSTPVTVGGLLAGKTVSSIATSNAHSCAIADGTAYCWGASSAGRLGDGGTYNQSTPVTVGGLLAGKTVSSIAAGNAHSCAVADGDAYCWGSGSDGQLGNGGTSNQSTPVAVGGLLAGKTVSAIAAGNAYSCAIADGTAYCWGSGSFGRLGNGSTSSQTTPVAVGGLLAGKTISAVAASFYHSCAIADGTAYCWGGGFYNQLGNGSTSNQTTPVAVGGLLAGKTVSAVTASNAHSCAIADGSAYCWGYGSNGRLGNGSTSNQSTPVAVGGLLAGKTISSIAAGNAHSCAVADGDAYCWGSGSDGQLGNGSESDQSTPVPVNPIE